MRRDVTPWLSIVGIDEDGFLGLSPAARTLVETAEVLIGGARHLAMVPVSAAERRAWPSPIQPLVDAIPAMRGRRVCVLATGDPMSFGIGGTLARHIAIAEMTIVPAISAFSLAAARVAWPLESTVLLTLQGRPVETIGPHVAPGARLLILAHDRRSPREVAALLKERGFGQSEMTALAHMGGKKEAQISARAAEWIADVPDFHTLAVECVAGPDAVWHPRTGLPDDAFAHDGKLTKREVRAAALGKLIPHPGALLIDVGAGCGSVAIEWMRAEKNSRAIAIEPRPDRRTLAARNATALGVPGLGIRDGTAPDALTGLPDADAIFIGGGVSDATIHASQDKLKPGGRLVVHAVTLESEAALLASYRQHGGELTRIAVQHAEPIGNFSAWRPMMPVTQWAWRKR